MRRRSSAGASAGGGEARLPTPVGAQSTAPRLHCLHGEFQIWASPLRWGKELGGEMSWASRRSSACRLPRVRPLCALCSPAVHCLSALFQSSSSSWFS
ncbi:hypothetical protein PVAP13_6KG341700 [Panicum virgatum]|uniref:Uncharacterized protein n=1 Tax=Panicum virgatum TaxID=38727 RepID=A0A8T0RJ17_PANVG|nr:hypothetical protein PVAP13_6KG341700 [Panicum virgatum]